MDATVTNLKSAAAKPAGKAPHAAVCPADERGKACRLFGLTQDQPDVHGLLVKRLYVVTDRYAIYAAQDEGGPASVLSLTFALARDEKTARQMRMNIAPIAADLARISDAILAVKPGVMPCKRFALHRHRAFAMMARAMALAFDGATDEAKSVLNFVREAVEARRDSANRMRYVGAITCAFALIGVVGLAMRHFAWPPFAMMTEVGAARMVDVMLLGAVGAWFAVALDVQKVRMRHAISRAEMIYAGMVRVPVGVIAAAMVVLLAQGGWLPGMDADALSSANVYVLGFLAGFSEMLVPNALKESPNRAPAPAAAL